MVTGNILFPNMRFQTKDLVDFHKEFHPVTLCQDLLLYEVNKRNIWSTAKSNSWQDSSLTISKLVTVVTRQRAGMFPHYLLDLQSALVTHMGHWHLQVPYKYLAPPISLTLFYAHFICDRNCQSPTARNAQSFWAIFYDWWNWYILQRCQCGVCIYEIH